MNIKLILLKKVTKGIFLCSTAILFNACNGGGSEMNSDRLGNNSLQGKIKQSSISKPPNKNLKDNPEKNTIHLYQKDLNGRKNYISKNDPTLPTTIGWDSVNNRLAAENCWLFTEQATNSTGSVNAETAYSANVASENLNISDSVAVQFDFFSASTSDGYSSFSQSSSQSVNAYSMASGTGNIQFGITGIQPWALTLYQQDPDEFTQECGDKVLTKLPVKNLVTAGLSFYTNSDTFNQAFDGKLSAGFSIVKITTQIAAAFSDSATNAAANIHLITMGDYDTDLFKQASSQIKNCIASNGSSSDCISAFELFGEAATSQFTKNVRLVNQNPNEAQWAGFFVIDYNKPSDFSFITTKEALAEAGIKNPITSNPAFAPFKLSIQHNVDILQDLALANATFQNNIGPQLEKYLKTLQAYMDSGNNYDYEYVLQPDALSTIYTNALANSVNKFSAKINDCLRSTTTELINQNCSLLSANETVDSVINKYFTTPYGDKITSLLEAAITSSVDGLIYEIAYSGYNTGNGLQVIPPFNGYAVWIPASPNTKDGASFVLMIPNEKEELQNVIAQGKSVNFSPFIIYDALTRKNKEYFRTNSTLRENVGQLNPLMLSYNINDRFSIKAIGSYDGQTCLPFDSGSASCKYIYSIELFENYPLVFTLKDNYVPNGYNIFKTLYPWPQQPIKNKKSNSVNKTGFKV